MASQTFTGGAKSHALSSLASAASVVHISYDTDPPPPPPGWTRFVCISDSHSTLYPVPEGDVLLHAGDLTVDGTLKGFQKTINWLCSLPHPTKIIIAGNHDLPLDKPWYLKNRMRWFSHRQEILDRDEVMKVLTGQEAKDAGLVYLQNQRHEFQAKEGGRLWSIYGSPWSPNFGNWVFGYDIEAAADLVGSIPPTDILITHGPPYSILDIARYGTRAGCVALFEHLPLIQPKLHVFGHIHESNGAEIRAYNQVGRLTEPLVDPENSNQAGPFTIFVNAANTPGGPKARNPDYSRKGPGEAGFQPIVVDFLEAAL